MFRRDEDDQFSQIKPMFLVRYFPKFDSHPTPSPTKFGVQIPSNTFPYTTPEEMLPSVFKHRFGFGFFRSFLAKNPMSTSFYVQELHRALREQGPAIHSFRVVNATSLQAVAHVKVLEGHSIGVVLTQQGYKVNSYHTYTPTHRLIVFFLPDRFKTGRGSVTGF